MLTSLQRERIRTTGVKAEWHRTLASLPEAPFILLANEFFDALPARQFVRRGGAWCERRLAVGDDGALAFTLAPTAYPVEAEARQAAGARDGEVVEISPASRTAVQAIAERLTHRPGRALIVDYGYGQGTNGDTLQAVAKHTKVPVLEDIGAADLSAHVDFGALIRAGRGSGAQAFGPIGQGAFLRRLGIEARHAALMAHTNAEQQADLTKQLHRLTAPEAMGDLFQVLCLSSPGLPAATGLRAL